MDEGRMARDVELLQQVMQTHGLTVRGLADRSGIAEKTIYKYLADVRTLPSEVLRAAFELTGDLRLIQLVSGAVPIHVQVHGQTQPQEPAEPTNGRRRAPMRIPPIKVVLPNTLEAAEKVVRCGRLLTNILADGTFDHRDLPEIHEFQRVLADARQKLALCDAAVEGAREGISVDD